MAVLKKPSISRLMRVADKYRENLLNRNILLIGVRGEETDCVELRFLGRNFKHLTGVRTISPQLKGNQFWKMCMNHRLSQCDLDFDRNGIASQKLAAADKAFTPRNSMKCFGVSNGARKFVNVELFAGAMSACMGFSNFEAFYLDPVTLLDTSADREILRGQSFRVVGAYSKWITDRKYRDILYVNGNANWSNIGRRLPDDVSYVISLNE